MTVRLPLLMMMRKPPTGGGGGSVTVEEVLVPANIAGSASGTVTITTTLVSTDLVVVLLSKLATGTTTLTINGSAPTAYADWQNSSGTRLYVSTKTGLTGSHGVTYSTTSGSVVNRLSIFVIRGLSTSAITASAISDWSSATTTANTDEGPASQSVVAGQVGIFAGVCAIGTLTFPSNPTPSGWTTDRADTATTGSHSSAHRVFTGSGTAQANMRSTSSTNIGTVMLIAG